MLRFLVRCPSHIKRWGKRIKHGRKTSGLDGGCMLWDVNTEHGTWEVGYLLTLLLFKWPQLHPYLLGALELWEGQFKSWGAAVWHSVACCAFACNSKYKVVKTHWAILYCESCSSCMQLVVTLSCSSQAPPYKLFIILPAHFNHLIQWPYASFWCGRNIGEMIP